MALQERIPVTTPEQIAQTAALAAAIWTEHYAGLLPEGQPAYMVENSSPPPRSRGRSGRTAIGIFC